MSTSSITDSLAQDVRKLALSIPAASDNMEQQHAVESSNIGTLHGVVRQSLASRIISSENTPQDLRTLLKAKGLDELGKERRTAEELELIIIELLHFISKSLLDQDREDKQKLKQSSASDSTALLTPDSVHAQVDDGTSSLLYVVPGKSPNLLQDVAMGNYNNGTANVGSSVAAEKLRKIVVATGNPPPTAEACLGKKRSFEEDYPRSKFPALDI